MYALSAASGVLGNFGAKARRSFCLAFLVAWALFASLSPACEAQETAPLPAAEQPAASTDDEDATSPAEAFEQDMIGDDDDFGRQFTLPQNLSPWGMFMEADPVVKAVMVGLTLASIATWTVFFAKSFEIFRAKARLRRTLREIASARSVEAASRALAGRGDPCAWMVRSAEEEMHLSSAALAHAGADGLQERVALQLSRIEARAGRDLTRGTGILATIGSTAPFVGLFGTVWGIMNSFIAISEAQTSNLAIVAPGIAEALLATAIGLVAAIPAVIFYNLFARAIAGYRHLLADGGAGVERLLSRDLDLLQQPARAG